MSEERRYRESTLKELAIVNTQVGRFDESRRNSKHGGLRGTRRSPHDFG